MSRELQGIIAEFSNAAAEGIRQCLAVAEDLQEEGGASEFKEMVREQLLAMVRLEREAGHIKTSLEHVQTVAAGVQTTDPPEEPPVLLDEMEDKLKALMEEPFDPCSHASVQELTRLLASDGGVGDVHETEEEVQVERIQQSLKCPLTGGYLEDPVRNPECGHTYSRGAVLEHIRHSRASRGARCPVCSGPLSGVSLQPQPRLAKKARRARRKEGLP